MDVGMETMSALTWIQVKASWDDVWLQQIKFYVRICVTKLDALHLQRKETNSVHQHIAINSCLPLEYIFGWLITKFFRSLVSVTVIEKENKHSFFIALHIFYKSINRVEYVPLKLWAW